MPQKTKAKSTKRTKVKDLPKAKQELSGKSMKKVKGGGAIIHDVRKAGEKPVEY